MLVINCSPINHIIALVWSSWHNDRLPWQNLSGIMFHSINIIPLLSLQIALLNLWVRCCSFSSPIALRQHFSWIWPSHWSNIYIDHPHMTSQLSWRLRCNYLLLGWLLCYTLLQEIGVSCMTNPFLATKNESEYSLC